MDGSRLSALLRSVTADSHARAEGTAFIDALVRGRLPLPAYTDLLTQLHDVYESLEDAARTVREDDLGATVVVPGLERTAALAGDLDRLAGPGWREARRLPATQRYCTRLRAVAHEVGGYVAHSYTRYLGDLSGGRVLRGAVQRAHGLPDAALQFYSFDGLPRPKVVKDDLRARYDALPLEPQERAHVLQEARLAFDLNTVLLEELGATHLTE